jgi:hypothetical protein
MRRCPGKDPAGGLEGRSAVRWSLQALGGSPRGHAAAGLQLKRYRCCRSADVIGPFFRSGGRPITPVHPPQFRNATTRYVIDSSLLAIRSSRVARRGTAFAAVACA